MMTRPRETALKPAKSWARWIGWRWQIVIDTAENHVPDAPAVIHDAGAKLDRPGLSMTILKSLK